MTDVIASKNFLAYFNTTGDSPIIGAINSTFNGGAVFGALQGGKSSVFLQAVSFYSFRCCA